MKKQDSFRKINSRYLLFIPIIFFSIFTACKKEKSDPVIETKSVSGLTLREYTATGAIIERGDYKILDHGFVYILAPHASNVDNYSGTKVSLGATIDNDIFTTTFDIGDLSSYYYTDYKCFVKAFITNEKGTIYGNLDSTDLLILKVKSVVPAAGRLGDTVTVNGNLFNAIPSYNQVYFDNVIAQVISGTTTALRVIVPQNISSYYSNDYLTVKVISEGKQATLQEAFMIETYATDFIPHSGSWDAYITIHGAGLYNANLYFDDLFIETNEYSSTSMTVNVPYNIGKKQFKLYIHKNGDVLEVPGGYFVLNDLVVSPLSTTTYSPGSEIGLYGQMFNPQSSMNKLTLGDVTLNAYDWYTSYLYFSIPNSMPLGSYQPTLTNGIETITLGQTINIVQ
jgi:hypothetical protein